MLKPTKEAVDYYNYLISQNLSAAEEQQLQLVELQKEHGTLFGGRPLTNSLRPMFLGEHTYQFIQDTVYIIRQAILKIAAAYFNDRNTLNDLGMQEWELELAAIPTNVIRMSATARLDAFLTDYSFRFVELNAEVPAGIAYTNELAKIYNKLPIFQKFIQKYPLRFVSPLEHTIAGLLRTYHEEFGGLKELPTFAIVDFQNVPTVPEFELIKAYLERMGYGCEICDPRELECKKGWVYANGKKIDILYRRLLMNEFYGIKHECEAYLEGYKAQKTCFLNSFRSKLVHKKNIFSLLTNPEYTRILSEEEIHIIQKHIPWTRKFREHKERFHEQIIDLVAFARMEKNRFILKPNDDYGGEGVTLGFAVEQSEWESAISHALENGDFVIQEVIEIGKEPFLLNIENEWKMMDTVIDLDPYLNGPLMGGCLTRTSFTNLANVTAGGGTLPMFIARYL